MVKEKNNDMLNYLNILFQINKYRKEWSMINKMIESCLTCKFVKKQEKGLNFHMCRRFPPVHALAGSMYPVVDVNWWCGEWKPKEIENVS